MTPSRSNFMQVVVSERGSKLPLLMLWQSAKTLFARQPHDSLGYDLPFFGPSIPVFCLSFSRTAPIPLSPLVIILLCLPICGGPGNVSRQGFRPSRREKSQ